MADIADFVRKERMDEAQSLTSRTFAREEMTAAHFRRSWSDPVPIDSNPLADAFMIVVPMIDLPAHGGWLNGRRMEVRARPAGCLGYRDFRLDWVADLSEPFETFNFFMPRSTFEELTDEYGGDRIERMNCPFTVETQQDSNALGLVGAILPLLQRPHEATALFADHIFGAARLHFAVRYGGLRVPERRRGGRLAAWQERRARQLMLEDIAADVSVSQIATSCGLSSRQFERAFQRSFGQPPHRWRNAQRIVRARELIETTSLPLAGIALTCGFVDQSHLTRVFGTVLGVTPSAYRRARRS